MQVIGNEQFFKVGPKPIFAAFVNWCYADDIRKRMTWFYAERKSKISVSQIFSKELAQRQNEALKKRKILQESPELNTYLEFPAHLIAKKKNNQDKYKKIERYQATLCQYVL